MVQLDVISMQMKTNGSIFFVRHWSNVRAEHLGVENRSPRGVHIYGFVDQIGPQQSCICSSDFEDNASQDLTQNLMP